MKYYRTYWEQSSLEYATWIFSEVDNQGYEIRKLNFKFKLASKKKFSGRLVVQAFFRIVINPIFDESDFFGSRFLSSFR